MELAQNTVTLCGYMTAPPVFSHENHGRQFFRFYLEVPRLSGAVDLLPVLADRGLLDSTDMTLGGAIRIRGQLRSFNSRAQIGRKLILSVFAAALECCDAPPENSVLLSGALCKSPVGRRTPLGREICDVMLAVSRKYHRTDYIPCIFWGKTARQLAQMPVGTCVELAGRLQSRNYIKMLPEGAEERTAYEVSVSQVLFSDEEERDAIFAAEK